MDNCDSGFEYDDDMEQDMDTDEDDDYYQEDVSSQLKRHDVPQDYEVLNAEQIYQNMVKTCEKVSVILELPNASTARPLLDHFKWDSDKLLEAYYDGKEAKVFKDSKDCFDIPKGNYGETDDDACEICFCSKNEVEMYKASCEHQFCKDCWSQYLTTKIKDDGVANIKCPGHNCAFQMDDGIILSLIEDRGVKQIHQKLITNSFVECNRLMKYCNKTDCYHAVLVQTVGCKPVTCNCGATFCFNCREQWHAAVSCELLMKWIKKCQDDSETSHWLQANTKCCPKCFVTIEKNGGCNHMTCTSVACGSHFCWICLCCWGKEAGYQSHPCSQYETSPQDTTRVNESRAALERYLFYNTRYMSHFQSMKFENKVVEMVNTKVAEWEELNIMSRIEAKFLFNAIDVLRSCRQTLMHTHVFSYYVCADNQSAIFEANQQDLETATERLSGYLEREVETETVILELKLTVQDLLRYCEQRRKVILDHVQEGYANKSWKFNDNL